MDLAPGPGTSAVSPELWVLPSRGKATETLPWLPPAESLGLSSALMEILAPQSQLCLPESFLQEQGMKRGVTSKGSALPQAASGGCVQDFPTTSRPRPGKFSSIQSCLAGILLDNLSTPCSFQLPGAHSEALLCCAKPSLG